MQHTDINKIVARFGLTHATVSEPQSGYRNSTYLVRTKDRDYNLILFKREHNMLNLVCLSNAVGGFLYRSGLPARTPADERIMQVYAGLDGRPPQYAGLYNYLPGHTIAWEAYTRAHLLSMGKAMSDTHTVLRNFPLSSSMPRTADTLRTLLERMEQYFCQEGVQRALATKLGLHTQFNMGQLQQLVASLALSRHQHMLHMDFVRGNVLFGKNGSVTGVIDFEKASVGHPLFDIARTLAFLIVDCMHKDEETVVHTFLNRGYQKRGQGSVPRIRSASQGDQTQRVLDGLVTLFLVTDLYKFLLHNPYQSLLANHHFMRTRDQLIKRNILTAPKQHG